MVILPVEDTGLEVRRVQSEELLYISADPERVRVPMTIERLADAPLILYDARWAAQDPARRQLRERAQLAGVRVEPVIEVEYMTAAFDLTLRGLGDTVSVASLLRARQLHTTTFDPPFVETFALITRRGAHLSPGTRAFMGMVEEALT